MKHEMPLSVIAFQNANGSTGELNIHDTDAIHNEEGSVDGQNIADGSVQAEDIASDAITAEKLASGSVGEDAIQDGSITLDKLSPELIEVLENITPEPIVTTLNSATTLIQCGRVCIVHIYFAGHASLGNNGSATIATLPATVRPVNTAINRAHSWLSSSGKPGISYLSAQADGNIRVVNSYYGQNVDTTSGEVVFINSLKPTKE